MKVAVYCGAATGHNPIYAEAAKELASWLVHKNLDVIYGGGSVGLMGVLADTILEQGGKIIGVMPDFLIEREIAHDQLTELISAPNMAERKQIMIDRSNVCIALPGGPGTLEEIAEAISWARIGQSDNVCVFYNVNHYYDALRDFYQKMRDEGFLSEKDFARIAFVDHLDAIEPFVNSLPPQEIRTYK
ncbi:LOG family protein [Streptococcus moroccensis]|uniref:Cytokinin riboside 5'-monophosphate phosphoribohydrolase n=1 Tax=Streptococcus moroccensis TaxID=1451356 RepID=A0ABT9YRX7_9STRE|nr:TIGR00730 family Rossman fold protein [Streptococcus moroccensis]MDQ0222751.1 uncharacterized protein (TIGR00730 family) [Streptococcus moroccensis]